MKGCVFNILIKLELRKNNLTPYIFGGLTIFIFTLLIGCMFSFTPILEPSSIDNHIFQDPKTLIIMVSVLSMSGFSILSAVMHSKFTVEEYTGKKNILLFTYPQKRSSILFAKFILVFTFTFIYMIITNLLNVSLIFLMGTFIGYMDTPYDLNLIAYTTLLSILFSLIANLISMISLRVGFWKKSIILTVLTSVILVSPFGNLAILLKNNLLEIIFPTTLILIIICTILFLGLLKNVNEMESL